MKQMAQRGGRVENEQIKAIREEVERLLREPEFEKMSKTFVHTLSQRLGRKGFREGGLVLESRAPLSLRDVLDATGLASPKDLVAQWEDTPYSYGNIYTYSFW